MAAGGEAQDPDLVRRQVPSGGVLAHQADRPLRVLERRQVPRLPLARGNPVLEDDPRDAQAVQPRGDVGSLVVHHEHPVTAAGADDDRDAGILGFRRREQGECRSGHVPDPRKGFLPGLVVIQNFLADRAGLPRRLAGPDVDRLPLLERVGGGRGEGENRQYRHQTHHAGSPFPELIRILYTLGRLKNDAKGTRVG